MAIKKNKEKQKNILLKTFSKSKIETIISYYKLQQQKIRENKRKQFTFFVLGFVVIYLLLTTIIYPFEMPAKIFTGSISELLMGIQGVETTFLGLIEFELEEAYAFTINHTNQLIVISWLCTGILEIIILVSAILASFGIALKKKLIGVLFAIISGFIFNFIRIWITLNIIMMQEAQVFEIAHDVLFRLTLLIYIVIVYVIWFSWAEGKLK